MKLRFNVRFSNIFIICCLIIALLIGVIVFLWFDAFEIKGFDKALEGILLLSSISLGFYGACLSVLASIFNTKIVKEIMNDSEYKKDFIIISGLALVTGFVLVIGTIVYQVILENNMSINIMRAINSIWFGTLVLFLSFSILFITISFLIFFKNTGEDENEQTREAKCREIKNPNF